MSSDSVLVVESVATESARRAPTLNDVARAAGVSLSTAARVLRDPATKVAPDLVERVQLAARELDYVPNVLARSLRGGTQTMVGLIVGDMLDPYYGVIAETVTEAAETAHQMVAIVSNMQRSAELELKHCEQLWQRRVSGLILAGGGFDQHTHFEQLRALILRVQASSNSWLCTFVLLADVLLVAPDPDRIMSQCQHNMLRVV